MIHQILLDPFSNISHAPPATSYQPRANFALAVTIPEGERYNLASQIKRAATSIALNIAGGSTGQSDTEQKRFLSMAIRSFLETVASLDLIEQQNYVGQKKSHPYVKRDMNYLLN